MTTRRTFLQSGAWATLAAARRVSVRPLVTAGYSHTQYPSEPTGRGHFPRSDDPDVHALTMRALDAARSSGASYADVRVTRTQRRMIGEDPLTDSLHLAAGVRVLVDGAWGFAATTQLTPEAIVRTSRMAVDQAKASVWPNVSPIVLQDDIPVATGHWQTPIQRDPFTVSADETKDYVDQVVAKAGTLQPAGLRAIVLTFRFERQDRTFAATTGAFATQTIFTAFSQDPRPVEKSIESAFGVSVQNQRGSVRSYFIPTVSPVGAGYEVLDGLNVVEHLAEWVEIAAQLADAKSFQALGAYDVVFDAHAMAAIVNATCGVALEYDRAVGYDAADGGTSYLAPPANVLGTPWAPESVTIVADRTLTGGAATVHWDDDGVSPRPTPLIHAGRVADYAMSREFVPELAAWYRQHGVPLHSNGCAASENALAIPLVHTPNLVLEPGPHTHGFDALLSGIDHGYVVCGGDGVMMDFQQLTGRLGQLESGDSLRVYQVKHGKLSEPIKDVTVVFKSPELWRSLVALGGPQTQATHGFVSAKGKPAQRAMHTVRAVAARFQNVRMQYAD